MRALSNLYCRLQIGPNWENYGPENVKAGAFQASYMDGEEKHWLVAEKCPFTGTKSAVWNLIAINDGTSALWGGQYNNSKTSKAGLTGKCRCCGVFF